jgi:hypothetical protein
MRARPVVAAAAALLGSLLAVSLGVGPSAGAPARPADVPVDGATGLPPVAADDSVTIWNGDFADPDVLANDSDPGGDVLNVCRVDNTSPAVRGVILGDALDATTATGPTTDLAVVTQNDAPAGSYDLPYQACDGQYLAAATVHVTVVRVAHVQVSKTGKPGQLRITNPSPYAVTVDVNSDDEPVIIGTFSGVYAFDSLVFASRHLSAHESVLVSVPRHRVEWDAYILKGNIETHEMGSGIVSHISLPKHPRRHGRIPDDHRAIARAAEAEARRSASLRAQISAAGVSPSRDDVAASPSSAPVWPPSTFDPSVDPTQTAPPSATDDAISSWVGPEIIDPLANDSDPADEPLDVCAVGSTSRNIAVQSTGDGIYVDTFKPGTYTIPYAACNEHRLAQATITLTVSAASPLEVTTDPAHPSRIVVTNPNTTRAWIDADDFRTHPVADPHWIAPGASVRMVFRHRFGTWVAGLSGGGDAGHGRLRNVPLTKAAAAADYSVASDLTWFPIVGVLPAVATP